GVGERRERLIERDIDQAAVMERGRGLDLRDHVLQEQVGGVQTTGVVGRRVGGVRIREATGEVVPVADGVVRVRSVVRRDPVERRDLVGGQLEVVVETV